MKYSPDEHDGCVPESETPETDAFHESMHDRHSINAYYDFACSLERRLSLAQTEIKGLKHDIARHLAICSEQATRIAELEKALAAHGTDAPGGIFS